MLTAEGVVAGFVQDVAVPAFTRMPDERTMQCNAAFLSFHFVLNSSLRPGTAAAPPSPPQLLRDSDSGADLG